MVGYGVFEVHNLFEKIKTEAFRCKVETEHQIPPTTYPFKRFNRRVINSKFRKLIERLECLSSGEQVGKLGVLTCDWNGTPHTSYVKVLLDKIISSEFVDNFRSTKLNISLLKSLKSTLLMVQAILYDDDMLWIQAILHEDNDDVQITLLDLQDAGYAEKCCL
jgi:hypothetical protein